MNPSTLDYKGSTREYPTAILADTGFADNLALISETMEHT